MFSFLKYTSPTWYYNLRTRDRAHYLANFHSLDVGNRTLIDEAGCYSANEIELLDKAYQAWLKGIVVRQSGDPDLLGVEPSIRDEYRFLRRFFSPFWSVFVLAVRLMELNNPVREAGAFISSLGTKRINPYSRTKDWRSELKNFSSGLLLQRPRVSVVIPTLNRYEYLKDALSDLEKQDYTNFEVLVVDQSEPYRLDFYEPYALDIKLLRQEEKALWLARNTAITESRGELVLLFDDDSRVGPDWISSHIKCLDFFDSDLSSGVSISAVGARVPETYSYYKLGDQIDTGNVMLRKRVFREIGLFDRQFEKQRQGDGEFGLRAYLAGFANISNPDAVRLHLKAANGGLREMGSWDGWRPTSLFAPRPVPSVLYLTRKYFGNRAAVYQILQSVLPSIVPYRFKRSRAILVAGSLLGVVLSPLIIISVARSWRLATKKLRQGAMISHLE